MPAITPADRERILQLHKRGVGRNAIARDTGFSPSTVTGVCKAAGVGFDRNDTAAAVQAHAIDLRARRQKIIDRLYRRAETNLDRLEGDEYRYRIVTGGEFATSETVEDDAPPSADERNHATSIQTYLTAAAKLEAADADGGATDAASMLARLGEALGVTGPA